MIWLVLGVLLWAAAHYFKRLAPVQRAELGDRGKGLIAILLFAAIGLMVVGYKSANGPLLWDLGAGAFHANNLLMLIAVVLFSTGKSNSRLRSRFRHPMLMAALVWSAAHLLVNGDLESLLLFGGIGLWVMGAVALINQAEPDYAAWQGGTVAGDVRLIVTSVVTLAIIAGIHMLLGPTPFPWLSF